MEWAYGVTTVSSRRDTTLPPTLDSLVDAGFSDPHLFVDGDAAGFEQFGLDVTARTPAIKTAGNWFLSLWELYIRNPNADRYALFQDDLLARPGLRDYLESCDYPDRGYWNLYHSAFNERKCPDTLGWHKARVKGSGALALVFDQTTALAILTGTFFAERFQDPQRSWKAVDHAVACCLSRRGYWSIAEYVHNPSLVQHVGDKSSMGKRPIRKSRSWNDELLAGPAMPLT